MKSSLSLSSFIEDNQIKKIEEELFDRCMMCIQIIKDKCLKLASDTESKVFFNKLIGDYYRYLAETSSGEKL